MYLVDKDVLNLIDDLDDNISKINPWWIKEALIHTKKLIENILSSIWIKWKNKFKFESWNPNKTELWIILENRWSTPNYITVWHIKILLELILVWLNEWYTNINNQNETFKQTVIVLIKNIITHIDVIIEKNWYNQPKLIWRI